MCGELQQICCEIAKRCGLIAFELHFIEKLEGKSDGSVGKATAMVAIYTMDFAPVKDKISKACDGNFHDFCQAMFKLSVVSCHSVATFSDQRIANSEMRLAIGDVV